ncbi:hypothetical protein MNBD_IGNAVI01-1525 [hydrothermal vent metagenome]|uniref:Peptidase M14 domain-containing protein n=1 Tax=hydrothermal vent metagenome TaxID=652676 RepID=A0A3B1BU45_9ZZZZ
MNLKINIILFSLLLLLYSCGSKEFEEVSRFETFSDNYKSGLYHTLDGIYNQLNEYKKAYPDKVKLVNIGKSEHFEKMLPFIRIQLGNSETSKQYLFVAGTHGDEAAAVEAMLFTIDQLLKNNIPVNATIDFVLVHNPDGFIENERTNFAGTDLNRTFPFPSNDVKILTENKAIMDLVNSNKYKASLFFHTANEDKYENLIRVPIEYNQYGTTAFTANAKADIEKLVSIVQFANQDNISKVAWHSSSELVNKNGIASDWCSSGLLNDSVKELSVNPPKYSHPSLTIELCSPKQPLQVDKLDEEKKETYNIVLNVIKNI